MNPKRSPALPEVCRYWGDPKQPRSPSGAPVPTSIGMPANGSRTIPRPSCAHVLYAVPAHG